ncbi:hypothetical protein KJ810_01195 [Patescibacteria group bacterium]|nr:hypothetical protein [Patescibacteria group bacterium]
MVEQKSKKTSTQSSNKNNPKKLTKKGNTKKDTAEDGFETITSIYQDDQHKEVDMTKLDRKKLTKKKLLGYFIIAFLFMLAVASVAGFFMFNRGLSNGDNSIQLTITAPKEVASGEEVEFEITYLNKENVAISEADITLLYPEGFYFSRSEPESANESHTFWKLKSIPSGAGGRVKIYGQVIGEIDETKTFQATMDYTPSNFSSTFKEKISHSLEITSSIFDLALETPLRIVSGQDTEMKITVKNNSEIDLSNVKVIATYPDDFLLKSSDPEVMDDKKTWFFKELKTKGEELITLNGVFKGDPGDSQEIKMQLGLVMNNGEFRLQNEKSAIIFLVKPELNLQLTVDGYNQEHSVNLGDILEYKVAYQNVSDLKLENVVLQAQFDSDTQILDFSSIEDASSGVIDEELKTITWSAEEMGELASIVPRAEGSFAVTIPIVTSLSPQKSTDNNFSIETFVKVNSLEAEDTGNFETMSESNHITVKMNSKVNLQAEARYYSDEFEKLGSGPLPPIVGEATTYRVFWTVSNLYNDLKNVEISTVLPKDVSWNGNSTGSSNTKVNFDRATRTITWKIQNLPANSGTLLPIAEATFDVTITPTSQYVGRLVVLTQESILSGRDNFTGFDLEVDDRVITTDLENDVAARGRGVVVEELEIVNSNINTNSNE